MHLLTHGKQKPLKVPTPISSPVKPSAPQIDYDQVTKKNDVSSLTTMPFHTANQSPSLYPTLSDVNQESKVNDQSIEVSRKRHSTSVSTSEGKKACVGSTPTRMQQSSQSWFSQFLRK